jgi:hypothetical protein
MRRPQYCSQHRFPERAQFMVSPYCERSVSRPIHIPGPVQCSVKLGSKTRQWVPNGNQGLLLTVRFYRHQHSGEPSYNAIGLCDTLSVASDTHWYQLIRHHLPQQYTPRLEQHSFITTQNIQSPSWRIRVRPYIYCFSFFLRDEFTPKHRLSIGLL